MLIQIIKLRAPVQAFSVPDAPHKRSILSHTPH